MSLAQITQKIENDAKAEAKKLLDRAQEQKTQIKAEAEAEVKKLEAASAERFSHERPEIFKRREIVARLDVNKLHLESQRRLIQDVFDGALKKLQALDKDKYQNFFKALLKNASKEGGTQLVLSKDEKYIDGAWIDKFNSENGTKIALSPAKGDFNGGFVLENGRIDTNCSFEMLVQAAQESLETKVVKRLFQS